MKYLTYTVVLYLMLTKVHAQSGNIIGKVSDNLSGKFLPLTTITIFKAIDTTIVTYRMSNEKGEFKVPSLPLNTNLRLLATYSGFEAYRKDFILSDTAYSIDFGNIKLQPTQKSLDDVIVIAERPPVIIKKDTIEFNASAFKTLPTALLEDLLKKLPGVSVDDNGDITVNGQKVNRLLVDGKRFFGDDPKMATRNLPSNLIDRIQVVDDKEELALNNDGDLSRIGKVLNIRLKKEVKKAVFGRLFAGGSGTHSLYEAGGIINSFRDTFQVSLIGFSNNLNRSSFSLKDASKLGGFERSGSGNINGNGNIAGQQGFSIDGFSFGGTGTGINKATGIGININHSPNKRINFYLQYFLGKTRNITDQYQDLEHFYDDTLITTKTHTNPIAYGTSHSLGFGGNLTTDSLTTIKSRFSFSHLDINTTATNSILTENNKLGLINTGSGLLNNSNTSTTYNQQITFTHQGRRKKGRNLSIFHYLTYNSNPISNITESNNYYQSPTVYNSLFQQLRSTNAPTTSIFFNTSYADQINKQLTFHLTSNFTYIKNSQAVLTYSKSKTGNYDSLLTTLSNEMNRELYKLSNGTSLGLRVKSISINAGANWLLQWVNNRFQFLSTNSTQYYSNLLFNFNLNWKRYSIGLTQDIIAPSINYLIPVPDNSNPFYIINGNPGLLPTKRTVINFSGTEYNIKKNISYFLRAQSAIANNSILQSIQIHPNGIQEITPINLNGAIYNYLSIGLNKQYKKSQTFNLTVTASLTGNINRVPTVFNNVASFVTNYIGGINTGFAFNWNDKIEFNPKYMPSINKIHYSNATFSDKEIVSQTLQGEFIVRIPKKIVWETNILYRYVGDATPGLPQTSTYWNAAVTVLMLKEDKGQLRFGVYDILNKNNLINKSFNANSLIYSETNVLPRYFLLSFSYNIRSYKGESNKVGGFNGMFRL